MKKSALLVIDVQKDFTQSSGRLPVDMNQAEQMIANLNAIVDSLDPDSTLTVYIGNEFRKFDPLNIFRNFFAIGGADGCRLDPRLKIARKYYFSKQEGNALSNASLVSFLRQSNIEHLYLTGLQAEACVYRTFRGALKHGFSCSVIQDAIASKTEAKRQRMLREFSSQGANILSTAQFLERCDSQSDHQPLVDCKTNPAS
jgi:nicotinamidase/pyrazinamidase